MNNEKQRIAIAAMCGITIPEHWKGDAQNEASFARWHVPKYTTCLNAMHEAEKMLKEHQWDEYERVLRLVCDGCSCFEGAGKELLHATAAQRAEAFLRTIGEWENDK